MTNDEAIKELSVLWERMKRAKESGVLAYKTIMYYDGQYVEALDLAIKALEQELKTGHWSNKCVCSVCGNQPWYYGSTFRKDYKFCPYCGARMESEDET